MLFLYLLDCPMTAQKLSDGYLHSPEAMRVDWVISQSANVSATECVHLCIRLLVEFFLTIYPADQLPGLSATVLCSAGQTAHKGVQGPVKCK